MKKIIILIFVLTLMQMLLVPIRAHCEYEDRKDEISEELDNILSDNGTDFSVKDIDDMTFSSLSERLKNTVAEKLLMPFHVLKLLLIVIILTSLLRRLGEGILDSGNKMYDLICVLTSVTIISAPIIEVYKNSMAVIERTGSFMTVFVPVFTGITVASGGVLTGSFYSFTVLGATEVFIALAGSFLMPLLNISIVLSISGSVFRTSSNAELMACIRKIVTWGLTIFISLFIGFIMLKSNITASSDGAATKTVKTLMSGFVPVVGSSVSDAYSAVKASFGIIRSTAGTVGCLAIIFMMLPPVIEIIVYRAIICIIVFLAEIMSADPIVALLKGIDGGLAIAQSVLVSYTVMLTLSTAIIIQQFG